MLRKLFVAAIMSVLVVVGQINLCGAMPYREMFLGGFTVGSSYPEMVRAYGQPVRDKSHAEDNYSCHYGNSVEIGYNGTSNKIQHITVTANNGWKTPSGLAVGMNISDALDMYGEPDYKEIGANKTAYCHFHRDRKNYLDYGFVILFNNKSGKILELSLLGGSRMADFEQIYKNHLEYMVK